MKQLEGIELIQDAIKSSDVEYMRMQMKAYLLYLEVNKKLGEFKINDYLAKDMHREILMGIYHDQGYMVATDAHIMICLKKDYSEDLEGKIISPKTGPIIGVYPKWRNVMPDMKENDMLYNIDFEEAKLIYNSYKMEKKLNLFHESVFALTHNDEKIYFDCKYLHAFTNGLKELKMSEVRIQAYDNGKLNIGRAIFNHNDNGYILLMPKVFRDDHDYTDTRIFYL